MSPEAVTQRMQILNQLWELAVALQTVEITDEKPKQKEEIKNEQRERDS